MLRELEPHEKLQELIRQSGVERKGLAESTKLNYFTLSKYIAGEREIVPQVAKTLIDYFSMLLGKKLPEDYFIKKNSLSEFHDQVVSIPVYNYKSEGSLRLNKQDISYETLVARDTLSDGDYFILRCDNFAIFNAISAHTEIIFRKQTFAEDGQLVTVMYSGKLLIRIIRQIDDHVFLYKLTPDSDIVIATPDEVKIMGRAVRVVLPL